MEFPLLGWTELLNFATRKLINQDIQKANDFMRGSVTDTEFFILFKDKSNEVIQKRIRTLISNLSSCGLIASQTSNEDLRMILDNFLNGGKTFTERTVTVE